MFRLIRKWIALFLLLWMPVSGASVLAASVSMQVGQGTVHEAAMTMMDHDDAAMQHDHCAAMQDQQADDTTGKSCDNCGVCHLACSAYLSAPDVSAVVLPNMLSNTPYHFGFHSVPSTPLVPPPLAAA
jgi:hypothetical protein